MTESISLKFKANDAITNVYIKYTEDMHNNEGPEIQSLRCYNYYAIGGCGSFGTTTTPFRINE